MKPETVAALALDILRERGWHQGNVEGPDGSACIMGALGHATGYRYGIHTVVVKAAARRIADVLELSDSNPYDVAAWNDSPHTTFEDVQLVLKRVANGEGVE